MTKTTLLLCALSAVALANTPKSPDDRYTKVLAKAELVEGQGFAGVLELGTPTPEMVKTFGVAEEKLGKPFWYVYDRGDWTLTVTADFDAKHDFKTHAIEITGAKAPGTKRGIHIGDKMTKVTKTYGKGEAFTGTIGSPRFAKHDDGEDPEAVYKTGVYYPKLSLLVVAKDGKVDRIVVVAPGTP